MIAGFAYMTGTLIQLDLTARIIPARAAAVSCWLVVPALRRAAPHWWDYRVQAAKG
jgi:hypothetical protein